ncbi:MAG TPA: radical SAM family heme chaperone HemW [Terriglobales bacterium]|nr:radical SAM family heme chaperone HemW [Terriglobales bacterium]
MPLGLYISVPFCRTKCSYCNFASDVFSRALFENYVARICSEVERSHQTTRQMGGLLESKVDSIYFGGGTPTLLDVAQLDRVFVTIRQNFEVTRDAEITLECAPGTLSGEMLAGLSRSGVNRISLGVQSFIDKESAAVGRLHNQQTVLGDIARLRSAGVSNINIDLIAGLPYQTRESWSRSLEELITLKVPHASIYMLEIDEDSRLGRELLAGGQRYHAHFVPDEDLTAELYETACECLNAAGIVQYEISNFARAGFESRHNLKYWTRQPYFGFGVDAHSMLSSDGKTGAVRFSNADSLEKYLAKSSRERTAVSPESALQEAFFLGLRLNSGVDLADLAARHGSRELTAFRDGISELISDGLLERCNEVIRLTARGRLLSNEVFQRFVADASTVGT